MNPRDRLSRLQDLMARRILVLDGALGTMLWRPGADLPPDALNLGAPARVAALHGDYFAAGADIVTTNTFSAAATATTGRGGMSVAMTRVREGVRLARGAAAKAERDCAGRICFVAGSLGPVHRSALLDGAIADRETLTTAYRAVVREVIAGGADLVIAETVFDAINLDAIVAAVLAERTESDHPIPLIVSATVDTEGHVGGQSPDAFWRTAARAAPLAVGLNCGFGPASLRAPLASLASLATCALSIAPNAGLPDTDGRYSEGARGMAEALRAMAEEGVVNFAGGCCGTTPEHIAAISAALKGVAPRAVSN